MNALVDEDDAETEATECLSNPSDEANIGWSVVGPLKKKVMKEKETTRGGRGPLCFYLKDPKKDKKPATWKPRHKQ